MCKTLGNITIKSIARYFPGPNKPAEFVTGDPCFGHSTLETTIRDPASWNPPFLPAIGSMSLGLLTAKWNCCGGCSGRECVERKTIVHTEEKSVPEDVANQVPTPPFGSQ
jgi:hypothetical protein